MRSYIFLSIILLLPFVAKAQSAIHGQVFELRSDQSQAPLPYANVYWADGSMGTITDSTGHFVINSPKNGERRLIAAFVGYSSDTLHLASNQKHAVLTLKPGAALGEVTVSGNLGGTYISKLTPAKTEFITEAGLRKLACCNLSEAFENNLTVDVGYSDAVTGSRQIQMLGLSGIYSQLLWENMPFNHGLAQAYGLNFIPGPFMKAIQVSKGTASVINGYESVSGQINVEYKKPETSEKLFVNVYGNSELMTEANITAAQRISEHASTMTMLHGSYMNTEWDRNNDGFMDDPMVKRLNLMHRWSVEHHGVGESVFGINGLFEDRIGGQMSNAQPSPVYGLYKTDIRTNRVQVFTKNGFMMPFDEYSSLGLQASYTWHDQAAMFGLRSYDAVQHSAYANLIWESRLGGKEEHKYNAGISYQYDTFDEQLTDSVWTRSESVPGVFAQYTWQPSVRFSLVAGARSDYNSQYGWLFTPRVHARYALSSQLTTRVSAGKGYRSPNVMAENISYLVSSRQLMFTQPADIEQAWNTGANLTYVQELLNGRSITWSADYYYTWFINQLVVNPDRDAHAVYFSNLDGKSYSSAVQAEVNVQWAEGINTILAARYNNVKTEYDGKLNEKPLVSPFKGLVTLSYAPAKSKWNVDFTTQYNGKARIPNTSGNAEPYRVEEWSPAYFYLLGQVTYKFKNLDLYVGAENITDYKQSNPILAANDPFGPDFDGSLVWGPVTGRKFYVGLRFFLK